MFAAGVFSAHADDGVWILNASGYWTNAVNWADGVVADGDGATAWLTNNITGNRTITLDGAPRNIGTLNIGDGVSSHAFTLNTTDGTALTLTNSSGKAQINQTATSNGDRISVPLVLGGGVAIANASSNLLTISSETTGAGDLTLLANDAGGITLNPPDIQDLPEWEINHVGKIVNQGSGTGTVLIGNLGNVQEGEIGPNVTGIVQDSATSKLVLGYYGWYAGGVTIKAGSVEGRRIQDSNLCNSFGMLGNTITLGDIAGSADATLVGGGAYTFPQSIVVASNNTGVAKITTTASTTFSGGVTLNDHDLMLETAATTLSMPGGFSGTGDLLLQANGAGAITLSTKKIDPVGEIVNAGTGAALVTLSAEIGENVTGVTQSSATSTLVLSGANTYAGPTTVATGSLRVANAAGSATGTGAVAVQTNGVLRGSGACLGTVTLDNGGTLSPGAAVNDRGVLTLGDLVWNEGGVLQCDVSSLSGGAPGVDYDQVVVDNALTAQPGGGKLVIKLSSLGQTLPVVAGQNYTLWLMQYGSASGLDIADIELDTSAFLVSGGTWFLTNMYNSICYVNRDGGPITPDPLKNCWIGSGKWSSAANWSFNHAPLAGEDVAFGSWSTAPCTADIVNDNLGSLTLGDPLNKVTFAPNAVSGGMSLTVTGNIAVDAGQLIFGGDTSTEFGTGYSIQAANISVAAGATLNADEQGFGPGTGPSPGGIGPAGYWGASHGGYGGVQYGNWTVLQTPAPRYGSASHPTSLGSGGALLAGGGALKLSASATIAIHGTLSASCTNQDSQCASGGSIWIAGGTLEGNGRIMANGGLAKNVDGGAGGGGGRIDLSGAVNNFTGVVEAMFGGRFTGRSGGAGLPSNYSPRRGMVGSILLPQSAGTGLTLDNFAPTRDIVFGNPVTFGNVTLTNVTVGVQAYEDETVITCNSLTIRDKGVLRCWGDTFAVNEASGGTTNYPHGHGVILNVGTATIDAGGAIDADNTGFHTVKYSTYMGPGGMDETLRDLGGTIDYYTSSAHGGQAGGRAGRAASWPSVLTRTPMYGNVYGPTSLGSGGSNYPDIFAANPIWYSGGGAVKMVVSGALTVNGRITADAICPGGYNMPSGGSVWITGGGTLQGSGRISANGSNASVDCGGGGGGRVDVSGMVNNFAGILQAKGGNKYSVATQQSRGLTGSLALPQTAGTSGAVIEDFVPYGVDFAFGNSTDFGDCVVTNGVVLTLDANEGENVFTFRSLTIEAGGTVRCVANLPAINAAAGGLHTAVRGAGVVIVATNLTIQSGGSLNADGQGYTHSYGNQSMLYPGNPGYDGVAAVPGFAGFGGLAGAGRGFTYGSVTNFGDGILGSGTAVYAGGGAIHLEVPGTLLNNGVISCDGAGADDNAGGSGGSLRIDCGTLAGSGTISARGGSAVAKTTTNYGGGGGRIYVSYSALNTPNPVDDGKITAYGGGTNSVSKGSAGTVVLEDKTAANGLTVLVNNDLPAVGTSTQFAIDDCGGVPPAMLFDRIYADANSALSVCADGTLAVDEIFSALGGFVGTPNGTLAFLGDSVCKVSGDIVATNLFVVGDALPKVVKFQPGSMITVGGALVTTNATLRSQVDGQKWHLVHEEGGQQSVVYTGAKDSDASGGQRIYSLRPNGDLAGGEYDLGGNKHWLFSNATMFLIR